MTPAQAKLHSKSAGKCATPGFFLLFGRAGIEKPEDVACGSRTATLTRSLYAETTA